MKTQLMFVVMLFYFFPFCAFCEEENDAIFFTPKMIHSHIKEYTTSEKLLIEKDKKVVSSVCFGEITGEIERPFYLATAGGIGARKNTILERFLREHTEYANAVYLDPDQRGLLFMAHTYQAISLNAYEAAREIDYSLITKRAYEKWRGASNYITLSLLEEAFKHRFNVIHGTTSTGEHVPAFLKRLHEKKYQIILMLCSCQDSLRRKAIYNRNIEQRFHQSTAEDAITKALVFNLRMRDYFTHGDIIYIYWSDDLYLRERLAAILEKGEIRVKDETALENFIHKYEVDCKKLKQEGKETVPWNDLVALYKDRFSTKRGVNNFK